MKILLINQTFYPDISATSQHLTDLAIALKDKGHQVTVLTGRRDYIDASVIYSARENYDGITILRAWTYEFSKNNMASRIIGSLLTNAAFAWKMLWLGKFDRIVAMTTPPLVGASAYFFSKIRNIPFIYWIMDLNPDQAVAFGILKEGSFYERLLNRVLKYILKGAANVIVLDEFMERRILTRKSTSRNVSVVPPWGREKLLQFVPDQENRFRKEHNIESRFTVMYSGNHSICHPLDTVLQAAIHLKEDPSVQFVFIGGGEGTKSVFRCKTEYDLQNVMQIPYQKNDNICQSLSSADLHIVVMGEPFVGIVHPSKVYSLMKLGKPFVYIGPMESPMGYLIASLNLGYHINHGEFEKLVDLIHEVKNMSEEKIKSISLEERDKVSQYSQDKQISKLINIIEESEVGIR